MSARWALLLVLGAVTCGPKAPPQPAAQPEPAPAAAEQNAAVEEAEAEPEPEPYVPDASCVPDCLGWYPDYADPDGAFRQYCEDYCAPVESLNMQCVMGCVDSKGPAAYYDEEGNYETYEDERSPEDQMADQYACEAECETVPTVGNMSGCVTACVEAGEGAEGRCSAECDPNPYDECSYLPCD